MVKRIKKYLPTLLEVFIYIAFFVVLAIQGYQRAIYHGELVWGDDFQWISWLYRIGYGEVPYKDFFALYGPILPYAFFIPFKIMGGGFLDWNLINYFGLPLISFVIAVLIARIVFKSRIFRVVLLIIMSIFPPYGFFLLQPWFFRFWLALFTFVIIFLRVYRRPVYRNFGRNFSKLLRSLSEILVSASVSFLHRQSFFPQTLRQKKREASQNLLSSPQFFEVSQNPVLRNRRFLLAGMWIGVVLFSSVDQGGYLLTSLGLVGVLGVLGVLGGLGRLGDKLPKEPKELRLLKIIGDGRVWGFGKGLGITVGIISFLLFISGALNNYISFAFFRLPATEMAMGGIAFPDFPLDKLDQGLRAFFGSAEFRFYVPIFIYGLSILWLIKEYILKREVRWPIVFLTIYGVFSFRTVLSRSDIEHLSTAFTAAVILTVFYCERAFLALPNLISSKDGAGRGIRVFRMIGAILFIGGTLGYFWGIRSDKTRGFLAIARPFELVMNKPPATMKYSPYVGLYINSEQAENLAKLMDFIKQNSEAGFYGHGWFTGLWFLTKTKNPTYFDYDDWATDQQQQKIIQNIERYGTSYIVTSSFRLKKGSLVDDYISFYYKLKDKYGDLIVFERETRVLEENFWDKRLITSFSGEWNRLKPKDDSLSTVRLVENGLTATGNLDYIFESTFSARTVSRVKMAVKTFFLPPLSMFAKTHAQLSFLDKDRKWQSIESDTHFVPKFDKEGQLVFHIYPPQVVRKMRLIFSAPGGFNPVPLDVKIEKTWVYR